MNESKTVDGLMLDIFSVLGWIEQVDRVRLRALFAERLALRAPAPSAWQPTPKDGPFFECP